MTNLIFSNTNVRIMNILTKHLKHNKSVYGFRMSSFEITIQSHYCPQIVNLLNNKKFKTSVNGVGYLQMTKKIGNMDLLFVFTD